MKIVLCTPTVKRPFDEFLAAVEQSVPALDAAGIEHNIVFEVGSAYISWARANMLSKAMEHGADAVVFLDHDLSWEPEDLVRLIQHPGDVVAGTYRYKEDEEKYMGTFEVDESNRPVVRDDGTIKARAVPAGFLKITRAAVERLSESHPELKFGPKEEFVDLFNHGAFNGVWWGEDYAFSRRWCLMGEEIYLLPDLKVNHHLNGQAYPGNLHEFLLKQPGGSNADSDK